MRRLIRTLEVAALGVLACGATSARADSEDWLARRNAYASGKILIGNFGNGRIHAFDNDGRFIDELEEGYGKPLVIDGLWTLTLGGGHGSSSDTLYFSAGPNQESNGLFGTITPIDAKPDHD